MKAPRPRSQAKLIQPENSRKKRERYGGGEQIKGYLSICGKEQSVRKDWHFSI